MRPSSVSRTHTGHDTMLDPVEATPVKAKAPGKGVLKQARMRMTKKVLLTHAADRKGLNISESMTKEEITDIWAVWDSTEAGLQHWAERLRGE